MKTLIKASVIGAVSTLAFAGAANALMVDFTDGTYPENIAVADPAKTFTNADSPTIDPNNDLGGVNMILTAVPGDLKNHESSPGPYFTAPFGKTLDGVTDGYGVRDDEVGAGESLTINFENTDGSLRNMWVSDIFLLDMFNEGETGETANIEFFKDGSSVGTVQISNEGAGSGPGVSVTGTGFAASAANNGGGDGFFGEILSTAPGGFLQLALADIVADFQFSFNQLVFTAGSDGGVSDFAVAGLRIADVNFVPVPAALPLALTGLVGLGLLGRRRKTA